MVTKAEMHKKMIKTVLEQLPQFIKRYSPEERVLLDKFMKQLNDFEKAEKNRTDLNNNYGEYTKGLLGTKEYLQTPFLWFAAAYFQKAKLTLNWSNFQAESFYEYLSKFLRKDPSYYGVFELIRKQTPLSDTRWEQLQYACMKMLYPLSKEQMRIIEKLITLTKNQGIYALDNRIVKKQLSELFPKGTKTEKVIIPFLTNLESQWNINYNDSAFGVEKFFFRMKGLSSKIDKIIPFEDKNNTILCLSNIYVSRENENDYLGILYVPTQDVKLLINYLENHERKGNLKVKELSMINTSYRGLSLERYSVNKGWPIINKGDLQRIINQLAQNNEEMTRFESSLTNFTPKFNKKWKFDQHQLPVELIRLYCEVHTNYKFSELPLPLINEKRKKTITKANVGFLKQLLYNNIMTVDWIPWRLVYEYSLDSYWIIINRKYLNKVNDFLKTVPLSMVYLTDEKLYIWLHLTPQIVKSLRKELDWQIIPISYYSPPRAPKFNWFNQEKIRWKTPEILISKKG